MGSEFIPNITTFVPILEVKENCFRSRLRVPASGLRLRVCPGAAMLFFWGFAKAFLVTKYIFTTETAKYMVFFA